MNMCGFFSVLCRNSRWSPKIVGKLYLGKFRQYTLQIYTLQVKNFIKIALFHTVSEINAFFCIFHRNSRFSAKNGEKMIFGKSPQWTLQVSCGSKISSNLLYLAPFFEILKIFHF